MSLQPVEEGQPHVPAHNLEREAINSLQDLSDPVFIQNLRDEILSHLDGFEGGGGDVSNKLDIVATFTTAPAAPIFRRDLNYDRTPNLPNLGEIAVNGVVRASTNDWGAHQYRVGVDEDWSHAGTQFVIEPGDVVTEGHFTELIDKRRPAGPGQTSYGRRWDDGKLIRNGREFIDTYYHDGELDTVPFDDLPNPCLVIVAIPLIEVG